MVVPHLWLFFFSLALGDCVGWYTVYLCVCFFSLLHKGAIHTGTGASSINKFLTTLNIPCPAEQTLKKRERESGEFVERAAKKACTEAIREERRLATGLIMTTAANVKQPSQGKTVMVSTTDNIDACLACKSALLGVILHTCKTCKRKQHHMCQTEDEQGCVCSSWFHRQTAADSSGGSVSIVASADTGWQKRGTGKNYNSLSGVGHLFGNRSGKFLAYSTRQKQCRVCDVGVREGKVPQKHKF